MQQEVKHLKQKTRRDGPRPADGRVGVLCSYQIISELAETFCLTKKTKVIRVREEFVPFCKRARCHGLALYFNSTRGPVAFTF